jgi:hypothetical protein
MPCGTCKHWHGDGEVYRECDLTRNYRDRKHQWSLAIAMSRGDAAAVLLTRRDFSCEQYSPREEAEEASQAVNDAGGA